LTRVCPNLKRKNPPVSARGQNESVLLGRREAKKNILPLKTGEKN